MSLKLYCTQEPFHMVERYAIAFVTFQRYVHTDSCSKHLVILVAIANQCFLPGSDALKGVFYFFCRHFFFFRQQTFAVAVDGQGGLVKCPVQFGGSFAFSCCPCRLGITKGYLYATFGTELHHGFPDGDASHDRGTANVLLALGS